jgi:hypothetical protein
MAGYGEEVLKGKERQEMYVNPYNKSNALLDFCVKMPLVTG